MRLCATLGSKFNPEAGFRRLLVLNNCDAGIDLGLPRANAVFCACHLELTNTSRHDFVRAGMASSPGRPELYFGRLPFASVTPMRS